MVLRSYSMFYVSFFVVISHVSLIFHIGTGKIVHILGHGTHRVTLVVVVLNISKSVLTIQMRVWIFMHAYTLATLLAVQSNADS